MLSLLRRIEFPEQVSTGGPVIKASLLHHVCNHNQLIDHAKAEAGDLLEQAQLEAERIREEVKQQTAHALRDDLSAIKTLTAQQEAALQKKASQLCTNICTTVLEQVLESTPPNQKIRVLIKALLERAHHSRELQIHAHPDQVELVEQEVAAHMAAQLNMKKWVVTGNPDLPVYNIRIATQNGSEIVVSLENMIALYNDEIQAMGGEINHVLLQETPQ